MLKISLNDLEQGFLERRLPFADSIYKYLHHDRDKAIKSYVTNVKYALEEFEENYMIKMWIPVNIDKDEYTFVDNYDLYLAGEIPEDKIILVPMAVHSVMAGYSARSSSWWTYRIPKLITSAGTFTVGAYCPFRLHEAWNSDGTISDEAHVYGFNIDQLQFFYNQFDLHMCRAIRSRSKIVQLGTGFDFLNLDETISELSEQVDKDKNTSAELYESWH